MRERISRLANGFIENEEPVLKTEPEKIEEELFTGQWQGTFRISSENHIQLKGLVYSDNPHVKIQNGQFKGYEASINYEVKLHEQENQDEISGNFYIVAWGAEKKVPFHFLLSGKKQMQKEARFETVKEFADFVKEEKEGGIRLFNSPHFEKQPFMDSLDLQTLYEGLQKKGHRGNGLEEFLVCAGAKEQIRISVVDSARKYQMPKQEFSDSIRIEKNTWGSLLVQLRTDAPFICLEKDRVTEKDFEGEECRIPYRIDAEKLHGGLNYGRILLETPYQSFSVDVSACLSSHRPEGNKSRLGFQRHLFQFVKRQLSYWAGTEEEGLLLNQMQADLSRIRTTYPTSVFYQVLHAHLYVLQKKPELASLLLDDAYGAVIKNRQEEPDVYCYYLYVRNLLENKEQQKATLKAIVGKYREEGVTSTLLFLLYMELEPRMKEDGSFRIEQMERQYDGGCRSPYLYLAACLTWEKEPMLLGRLGDFELQALNFGAKEGYVSPEVAVRAAGFFSSLKSFSKVYVRLLKILYEKYGKEEILTAVCALLMKGNVRTPESFFWYEKGVQADLRLTRLYEFYLCTRPEDEGDPLPEELVRYFSYHHSLGYEAKLVLYRYVLSSYMPGEELYDAYREQIERFVMEQVLKGEVDEKLAYLYQRVLYPEMVDEKAARILPAILYGVSISCPAKQMTHVVIRYQETREELRAPIRGGKAYVPLYSSHYCLFLQDGYGNRYTGIPCQIMPLMEREPLLSACLALVPQFRPVNIARCRRLLEEGMYERQTIDLFRETALDSGISPFFKKKLISAIIGWLHNSREGEPFGKDLLSLDVSAMSEKDRILWTETLIDRDYRMEAWEIIRVYGYENLGEARLLKLCSKKIVDALYEKEELLLSLSCRLFSLGKYDDIILEYLCRHENGSTGWMYRIWREAESSRIDTWDMDERLLGQMLFTGRFKHVGEVFRAYIRKKTADGMLVKAYFTVRCYQYFMDEEGMDEESFSYVESMCMEEGAPERIPLIHRLAVTKYYYGAFILTKEQIEFGRKLFYSIVQEGYVFAYLKSLSRKLGIFHSIQNCQILECRGEKGQTLTIRWRVLPDQMEFTEEKMVHMYQGIYVKQIVAFEGDTVEYEISRLNSDQWETVKKDSVLVYSEEGQIPAGRYGQMNHLLFLFRGGEEKELKKAMEDYGMKETVTEKWFQIKE